MIKKKTVIVLGAGASIPYDFPSGRNLLLLICSILKSQNTGTRDMLVHALSDRQDLRTVSKNIENFPLELENSMQPSVDLFLEHRKEYIERGKLAIAATLIPYERPDTLIARGDKMKWYEYLYQRLQLTPDNIRETNLSVITFNYDRSFEYFFLNAFKNSFGLNDDEAAEMCKEIEPIHLYGTLGKLKEIHGSGRQYINKINASILKVAADSIKIMSQGAYNEELEKAQKVIGNAKLIMFIGFGYHEENVNRLEIPRPGQSPDHVKVCGTAFKLGRGEMERVRLLIGGNMVLGENDEDALNFLKGSNELSWAETGP